MQNIYITYLLAERIIPKSASLSVGIGLDEDEEGADAESAFGMVADSDILKRDWVFRNCINNRKE